MFFLLIPLAVTAFSLSAKPNKKVASYIEKYKKIAKAEEKSKDGGIPHQITLAQAIIESRCGSSNLALRANNHFGIKAGDNYKTYENPIGSYKDHSRILRKYYASLFKLNKNDYKAWARGLQRLGYATDPCYATKIIKCIEDNGLSSI